MSYGRQLFQVRVDQIIFSPINTADYVHRLLALGPGQAKQVIGKETTVTAYRHIHEIVASILDRLIEEARRAKTGGHAIDKIIPLLTRALILIRYQAARSQISRNLADLLGQLLSIVTNQAKEVIAGRGNLEKLVIAAENARNVVDALAVIVYQYAR